MIISDENSQLPKNKLIPSFLCDGYGNLFDFIYCNNKKENNKPAGPAERRRAKTQCSMYMLSAPFKYCFEIRAASHSPTASHC